MRRHRENRTTADRSGPLAGRSTELSAGPGARASFGAVFGGAVAAFALSASALAGPVTWHPEGFVLRTKDGDPVADLEAVLDTVVSSSATARPTAPAKSSRRWLRKTHGSSCSTTRANSPAPPATSALSMPGEITWS